MKHTISSLVPPALLLGGGSILGFLVGDYLTNDMVVWWLYALLAFEGFCGVIIHEFAHYVVARFFGIDAKFGRNGIDPHVETASSIGDYKAQKWISVAGYTTNFIIGVVLLLFVTFPFGWISTWMGVIGLTWSDDAKAFRMSKEDWEAQFFKDEKMKQLFKDYSDIEILLGVPTYKDDPHILKAIEFELKRREREKDNSTPVV